MGFGPCPTIYTLINTVTVKYTVQNLKIFFERINCQKFIDIFIFTFQKKKISTSETQSE